MAPFVLAARCAFVGAAALLVAVACASPDQPRWSQPAAVDSPAAFASPRQTVVVEENPDIGTVAFRGTARGRAPEQVIAPADGRVLDVFFARDETIGKGDDVLVFVPAPSEAELIELEIARLEIDRAVARAESDEAIAEAQTAVENQLASFDARQQVIAAPSSGVIGSTRQNIAYSVNEGDVLFELSDPSDVVVELRVTVGDLASLAVGTKAVMERSSNAGDDLVKGTITDVPDAGDLPDSAEVVVTVMPDEPLSVELGQRFSVSLPVVATADARWVPLEAVDRQAGASFVLIVDDQDRLRRLDVLLGRRTLTHVQVLSGLEVDMRLVAHQ